MIRTIRNSVLQSLALLAGLFAFVTVNAEIGAKNALDFELSNGHRFVRLSQLAEQTTVINFWRSDCPPCIREMPILAKMAKDQRVQVVTIALQKPVETLNAPEFIRAALQAPVVSLNGPTEPRGLLARFGNPAGALPHTVVLDAQRQPCAQRTGEITPEWLKNAVARCTSS